MTRRLPIVISTPFAVATLVAPTSLAYASLPDQTWIKGSIYDVTDLDDAVLTATSVVAAKQTAQKVKSPMLTRTLPRPVCPAGLEPRLSAEDPGSLQKVVPPPWVARSPPATSSLQASPSGQNRP